jgi:hypothetical protein
VSTKDYDLQLTTVQHVIIMYTLFENEITRWHAPQQHFNDFCLSMRYGTDMAPFTPPSFVKEVYASTSLQNLRNLLYPRKQALKWMSEEEKVRGKVPPHVVNWMQVNISLPRGTGKKATLEFRHHRGTTDYEEIYWWVQFCGYLFTYVRPLTGELLPGLLVRLQNYPPALEPT